MSPRYASHSEWIVNDETNLHYEMMIGENFNIVCKQSREQLIEL